jgi:hypothetical protein
MRVAITAPPIPLAAEAEDQLARRLGRSSLTDVSTQVSASAA